MGTTILGLLYLRFSDSEVETAYLEQNRRTTLPFVRVAFLAGIVIWCAMGYLDLLIAGDSITTLWMLRFSAGLPALVLGLGASFHPRLEQRIEPLATGVTALVVVTYCAMIYSLESPAGHTHHVGLLTILLVLPGVSQMRFISTAGLMVLAVVGFHAASIGAGHPAAVIAQNDFFLLPCIAAAGWMSWVMEYLRRREYLRSTAMAQAANRDPMTGLLNRRELESRMEELRDMHARYGVASSLILVDLDDFKRVNDTYGHPAGDAVLISVAKALQSSVRRSDLAFRYGGDEFLILLPNTPEPEAFLLAQRLTDAVRQAAARESGDIGVSCSQGLGAIDSKRSATDLLARVDRAMYKSKRDGKGKISRVKLRSVSGSGV